MTDSVLIGEMPWTEYDERVRRGDAVVLLPVGALEQHGPHLPMNCDVVIPASIAERVARDWVDWWRRQLPMATSRSPSQAAATTFPAPQALTA